MRRAALTARSLPVVTFLPVLLDFQSTSAIGPIVGARTLSSAAPVGTLLLVTVETFNNDPTVTMVDSGGHTWSSLNWFGTGGSRVWIFWTVVTTAVTSITPSSSDSAYFKIQARCATGFDPTTPVSGTGTGDSAGSNAVNVIFGVNIDSAVARDGILMAVTVNQYRTWSALPSGFTSEVTSSNGSVSGTGLTAYRTYTAAAINQPDTGVLSAAGIMVNAAIRIKAKP